MSSDSKYLISSKANTHQRGELFSFGASSACMPDDACTLTGHLLIKQGQGMRGLEGLEPEDPLRIS